jgi:hypothetical protein
MAVKWEYKLGPLTLNFRVLLESKGFLRILMVIISILAFSITVGFTGGINDNSLSCNTTSNNASVGVELGFSYPFRESDFRAQYQPSEEVILNISNNTVSCGRAEGFRSKNFAGFAQYFVAMGVLSFLYCLGILLVYVIFINPDLPFAKWLIAFDFIASILFAFVYLLADILWSAGISLMKDYVGSELRRRGTVCLLCTENSINSDLGSYVQPAMSVVFGWLLCFVWFCSIWFTFKDTHWHKDRSGPLGGAYTSEEGADKGATPAGE